MIGEGSSPSRTLQGRGPVRRMDMAASVSLITPQALGLMSR